MADQTPKAETQADADDSKFDHLFESPETEQSAEPDAGSGDAVVDDAPTVSSAGTPEVRDAAEIGGAATGSDDASDAEVQAAYSERSEAAKTPVPREGDDLPTAGERFANAKQQAKNDARAVFHRACDGVAALWGIGQATGGALANLPRVTAQAVVAAVVFIGRAVVSLSRSASNTTYFGKNGALTKAFFLGAVGSGIAVGVPTALGTGLAFGLSLAQPVTTLSVSVIGFVLAALMDP